ncbi:MAG: hypothetical protein ICV57_06385 [Rubrobacter sp.]|nr:hypothetical protein [Rubrobacter sp.]
MSDPGSSVVMPMPEPSGVSTTFKVLLSSASLAGAAMCSRVSPSCSTP